MEPNEPTPATAAAEPADATGTAPAAPPRQVRLLLAGVALAAIVALLWPRGEETLTRGRLLMDAGGSPIPLADQLAPVTLLHFWSTWCPPCIEEAPAIDRLARDLERDGRFKVLMVAVADEATKVRRFAGVTADRVLYDPNWEVAHRYGTRQLPESYLLVGGRVVRKFTGAADWDDPRLRADIQRAIATAPAAGG